LASALDRLAFSAIASTSSALFMVKWFRVLRSGPNI
jgi:hypothetical protein